MQKNPKNPKNTIPSLARFIPSKSPSKAELRREEILSRLWPGWRKVTWSRKSEKGFATIPRTLPLICSLIRTHSKGDASRVYLDLWARVNDDGLVEVHDETEFALSCYPNGTRHVRTWRDHITQLKELGFISVKPKPSRRYGYILVLHPHRVVERMLRESPERISSTWLELYKNRLADIGAEAEFDDSLDKFLAEKSGNQISAA
jgi:hypothetical protein